MSGMPCLQIRVSRGRATTRFKSEFLADYWSRHGAPLRSRILGNLDMFSKWASPVAPLANLFTRAGWLNERLLGIDRRRKLPQWRRRTLSGLARGVRASAGEPEALLFNDTFTNHYNPEVGLAALEVLQASGIKTQLAPNACCGRALISQGLLEKARTYAARNTKLLAQIASKGTPIIFLEPSCLSAMREDNPSLLRGEEQESQGCGKCLRPFRRFSRTRMPVRPDASPATRRAEENFAARTLPPESHGTAAIRKGSSVAGSFRDGSGSRRRMLRNGRVFRLATEHYYISRRIAERRLLPAARGMEPGDVLAASGVSCRHQVEEFTGIAATHPAVLLQSLLAADR